MACCYWDEVLTVDMLLNIDSDLAFNNALLLSEFRCISLSITCVMNITLIINGIGVNKNTLRHCLVWYPMCLSFRTLEEKGLVSVDTCQSDFLFGAGVLVSLLET